MRFGKVAAGLTMAKGLGAYSKGAGMGFMGLFTPMKMMKGTMKGVGALGRDVIKGNQGLAARKSMELLGTAAGVTYATRLIRGRGIMRDRRGKKNIPWIPFV